MATAFKSPITVPTINNITFTQPATSATLTIANLGTLATSGAFSITLSATATTASTLPAGTDTLLGRASSDTITGAKTFNAGKFLLAGASSGSVQLNAANIAGAGLLTLPTGTDTLVGKATTDTLTNKTVSGSTNTLTSDAFSVPYKFRARRTTAQNTGNAAYAIVNFATEDYDTGSNFDTTTNVGRFTAPIAGFYHFDAHISTSAGVTILLIALFKNGVEYSRGNDIRYSTSNTAGVNVSDTIQLAANDFVEVYCFGNAATAIDTANNYFSGFLLSRI